jgi:membrane associated rhomboid family serine protease
MLIPLGTDRPLRRPTKVNHALVVANLAIFVAMAATKRLRPETESWLYATFWLDPRHVTLWGPLTYAFLHADFMHVLGNMLFLWVFGANVEDRFGRLGYLAFYVVGAVGAGAVHAVFEDAPVVGASGAISAVTGAYLVLFPKTQVKCLFLLIIGMVTIPAWWFIGGAMAWDLLQQGTSSRHNVAYLAHLGGYTFGAGVSIVLLWRKILAREPYDLFTISRQAYRRRLLREVAVRQQEEQRRRLAPRPGAEPDLRDHLAEARAAVTTLASRNDLPAAARAYKELVEKHADLPAATLLGRRYQLDIANQFFQEGDHESAAYTYERFLEAYKTDSESARVRLLLGLINARWLNDPVRARQLLDGLPPLLGDAEQRKLAETLLEELG